MAIVFSVLTIISLVFYMIYNNIPWFSITLTMFTISYHLIMRLAVGTVIDILTEKGLNHNSLWFREKSFEKALYKRLGVKKWKHIIPTWEPERFSVEENNMKKIIENMCAAELIHEIIVLLSWATLFFSLFTPDWKIYIWIFVGTAFLAAGCDMFFVILQRYNRPRVIRLYERNKSV
ncbi:MAG: hypothetical protein IJ416_01225 [Ruminiclostridium sp.]|nr:hypothetical protein [Ruminiclostridium sp.]